MKLNLLIATILVVASSAANAASSFLCKQNGKAIAHLLLQGDSVKVTYFDTGKSVNAYSVNGSSTNFFAQAACLATNCGDVDTRPTHLLLSPEVATGSNGRVQLNNEELQCRDAVSLN